MWISRRGLVRLERELSRAIRRAEAAEQALAAERQGKDWLTVQLASRIVTKHGGYGLAHEPPPPAPPPQPHPRGFVRDPTEIDYAKLEYYRQCARQAGKSEEEAEHIWEAEMRGESVRYEYDDENSEDRPM